VFSSKSEFANYCQLFQINPIPTFDPNEILRLSNESNIFPVVVKPIDSGAAVGISLCKNENELKSGIELALEKSIAKRIIVEKYMDCDDLFAYYTVINGKAHLTMLADRHKSSKAGAFNSVCLYANYPSRHLNPFLEGVNSKIVKMIESLRIDFGVLGIQIFYDGNNFYVYDPGFRIQGEGPHFYLDGIQEFDQIRMLLKFAAEGKISEDSNQFNSDPSLAGYLARTIWILGKPGTVSQIIGVEEILSKPNVLKILNRFSPGDLLSEDMIGTERQVLMRIYTFGKTQIELDEINHFIAETIQVIDQNGDSLISDLFVPKK
jgi:biotin carboxylase